jgi:NADPH2:quinone reductase
VPPPSAFERFLVLPDIDQAGLATCGVQVTQASAAATVKGAMLQQAAAEVFGLWQQGVFGDIELHRYPLTEAATAHEDIAARRIGPNPILVP